MRIRHIMKDGTIKDDVNGHIVKLSESKALYKLIENLSKRRGENE